MILDRGTKSEQLVNFSVAILFSPCQHWGGQRQKFALAFQRKHVMVVSTSTQKRRLSTPESGSDAAETPTSRKPDMEKNKALDAAMAQIERAFGKGSIMRMGAKGTSEAIEVIPSGSLGLDLALGIGGMPRGRVVEIYGPESSGKTTLALHAIAEAQKRGGVCAFIDAEHALDPDLCPQTRRRCRQPADLTARYRRAGAGDRRHAGALRLDRRAGGRLRRCFGAARRARGRDGRFPCRPARPADEPGAAQDHRLGRAQQHAC